LDFLGLMVSFFYEVYFFEKGDAWEAVEVCEGESTQS